jgi:hypothetical protein
MCIIKKLIDLPDDIIYIILDFIPRQNIACLNSSFYNTYHHLLKYYISMYESYVRDMIKRDNNYVFEKLVRENMNNWIENRRYRYKNMIFSNYIYFVLYFCMEQHSEKCYELLMNELLKRDLCRNLHKKNIIKYIKWTH